MAPKGEATMMSAKKKAQRPKGEEYKDGSGIRAAAYGGVGKKLDNYMSSHAQPDFHILAENYS